MNENKVYVFKDLNAIAAGEEEMKEVKPQKPREPVLRRRWRQKDEPSALRD